MNNFNNHSEYMYKGPNGAPYFIILIFVAISKYSL